MLETYNENIAWGGCSCWQPVTSMQAHVLEFKWPNRYSISHVSISSVNGCSGTFSRQNDSTLTWTSCSIIPQETKKIAYEGEFLILADEAGPYRLKYKYKRL